MTGFVNGKKVRDGVSYYDAAVLTPCRLALLDESPPPSTADRPHALYGAAYTSDGQLIRSSLRKGFPDVAPHDPVTLSEFEPQGETLAGTWLYGGHWFGHFGHFLLETLSTLWPAPTRAIAGLVFHHFPDVLGDAEPTAWQLDLLRRTGWRQKVVRVSKAPIKLERLMIPERGYVLHEGGSAGVVELWGRIAKKPRPRTPVFLSRTEVSSNGRALDGDRELDTQLERSGIRVVHPQGLSIAEQLRIVAGASHLVGISGSQLHLSIFAPSDIPVVEIGDARLPHTPVLDQTLLTDLRQQRHSFVPLIRSGNGRDAASTTDLVLSQLDSDPGQSEHGSRLRRA